MIRQVEGNDQQHKLRNLTMKESHGAIGIDQAPLAGTELQRIERSSPFPSRDSGHSLLLLQLRTELEGKWRPDKFGILRKWMHASPKHWKEDAFDNAIRPGFITHNGRKRNGHKRVRSKKVILPKPKPSFMERIGQQVAPTEENEKFVDCAGDSEVKSEKSRIRAQRFVLEEEVMMLQKQLQKEVELHLALENAINLSIGARPQHPQDIPTSARELLEDIAALERVVDALEDEAINLQGGIGHERKERESLQLNGLLPKDKHVTEESCPVPRRRQTKLSPVKLQKPSEKILVAKPVTLQDHLGGASVTSDCSGDLRISTPRSLSKLPPSENPRLVPLSWNSSSTSSQESVNSSLSSDSSSKHGYPSRLASHHCGHFSVAPQAEAHTPSSKFSPARNSFFGASICDQSGCLGESGSSEQSGSLGALSGSFGLSRGMEQDLCTSSQLISYGFPIPTSPGTPEHCVRPTSPAGASVGLRHFYDDGPLSTEEIPFVEVSRRMREPREGKYSLTKRNTFGTEEFFTPTNSISSFADSLGDSQPSSTENVKVRSKVRVKLNWEPAENLTKVNKGSPDHDSYDAEYVKHRSLVRGSSFLSPLNGWKKPCALESFVLVGFQERPGSDVPAPSSPWVPRLDPFSDPSPASSAQALPVTLGLDGRPPIINALPRCYYPGPSEEDLGSILHWNSARNLFTDLGEISISHSYSGKTLKSETSKVRRGGF